MDSIQLVVGNGAFVHGPTFTVQGRLSKVLQYLQGSPLEKSSIANVAVILTLSSYPG